LIAATEVPVSEAISSALHDSVWIGCAAIQWPTRASDGEASCAAAAMRCCAETPEDGDEGMNE
jgi:hypothetical protein